MSGRLQGRSLTVCPNRMLNAQITFYLCGRLQGRSLTVCPDSMLSALTRFRLCGRLQGRSLTVCPDRMLTLRHVSFMRPLARKSIDRLPGQDAERSMVVMSKANADLEMSCPDTVSSVRPHANTGLEMPGTDAALLHGWCEYVRPRRTASPPLLAPACQLLHGGLRVRRALVSHCSTGGEGTSGHRATLPPRRCPRCSLTCGLALYEGRFGRRVAPARR